MKHTLLLLFNFLTATILFSQTGQFFIENYPPHVYNGDGQIWSIVQDNRGIMYFGGNNAIYEFDGTNWSSIEQEGEKLSIRSLAVDSSGLIYVGCTSDLGYLSPNQKGKLEFVSLADQIDTAYRQFTDVWTMATIGKTVYFCTNEYLFRYNKDSIPKFKVIGEDVPFFLTHKIRNEIYVSTRDRGVVKIENDSIVSLPGSEDIFPWAMLPYSTDKFLVAMGADGLFVWDPLNSDTTKILTKEYFNQDEIVKTEQFLIENQMYLGATELNNNRYALSTIISGVVIIDDKGKILNVIDKQNNLLSQTVHYLFLDNQEQLWAGLTYGISHIETNSPFLFFNDKNGLNGSIYSAFRDENYFYATSNLGIYFWKNGKFVGIDEINKQALQVFNPVTFKYPNQNKIINVVITVAGMFSVEGEKVTNLNRLSPDAYFQSRFDSSKVWLSQDYGIAYLTLDDNLANHELVAEFDFFPYALAEYDKDNLWILGNNEIYLYNLENKKLKDFKENTELKDVTIYDGKYTDFGMLFYTNDGFYTFDETNEKFIEKNSILNKKLSGTEIVQFEKVSENSFWTSCVKGEKKYITIFDKTGDGFVCDTTPFKRLFEFDIFNTDGDSIMWIVSPNALYKFDVSYKKDYSTKNKVLIRKIFTDDSLIFEGAFFNTIDSIKYLSENASDDFIINLEYKNNNLHIEFALPEFDNPVENRYSYRLLGSDNENWSKWSDASYKELTNIREGSYVFQVKGKNIYGYESEISEIKFIDHPPWYRTTLAYIFYIILLAFVVWLAIKIYSIRLKKENERLDKIVKERTAEINQQKEEIKTQAENLTEVNSLLVEKNSQVNQQNEEIRAIAESLQAANKKIKHKNQYITDSINYAKRIQEAVLPNTEILNKLLPEYFILFKPKDIISGDFYWVKKIKNNLMIVVADSTGHGVPGGFISMLGMSILNEIVRKDEVQKPSQALEIMRRVVKTSLKQTSFEDSQDDGIDIGLAVINEENNLLTFSGAYIPLYILRDKTLHTLKAILNPIGIYPYEKPFVDETFELQNGDIMYMTSDGYKDQLNSNSGTFTSKRFKDIIIENSDKTMTEQQKILLENHENWKKNCPQTDDVLVMGIRWKIEQ